MLLAVLASLLLHAVAGRGLEQLPERPVVRKSYKVEMEVVRNDPPPPPPPETVFEAPTEEPKPPPKRRPKRRKPVKRDPKRKPPPPGNTTPRPNQPTTDTPVFGMSDASFSGSSAAGMAMPQGNTTMTSPDKAPPNKKAGPVRALAPPPEPVHEVTVMPKMVGRCRGRYTEKAQENGVEGVVVLELVVGANGRTRDIKVITGLGYGLDEAAIEALRKCRFKPGRKGDKKVAVRLRSFKIRFFLDDGA